MTVGIYSAPTFVGQFQTTAAGELNQAITLPGSLTGSHTIVAIGVDPAGAQRVLEAPVTIAVASGGTTGDSTTERRHQRQHPAGDRPRRLDPGAHHRLDRAAGGPGRRGALAPRAGPGDARRRPPPVGDVTPMGHPDSFTRPAYPGRGGTVTSLARMNPPETLDTRGADGGNVSRVTPQVTAFHLTERQRGEVKAPPVRPGGRVARFLEGKGKQSMKLRKTAAGGAAVALVAAGLTIGIAPGASAATGNIQTVNASSNNMKGQTVGATGRGVGDGTVNWGGNDTITITTSSPAKNQLDVAIALSQGPDNGPAACLGDWAVGQCSADTSVAGSCPYRLDVWLTVDGVGRPRRSPRQRSRPSPTSTLRRSAGPP